MGKTKAPRPKQLAIKHGKKTLPMAEGTATLGASRACLFRVEGAGITDHHVNLEFNGAVLTAAPAAEAEGITVNGKPLAKPQQMKPGDILAFGAHSFEIGAISNAPGAFRRTMRRWYVRFPLYAVGALAGLLLLIFVAAWIYLSPGRISGWITEALDSKLNCKSSIGSLTYSFGGRVAISDLEIQNKPEYGPGPCLKIGSLTARVSVLDLLFSQVNVQATLDKLELHLNRPLVAGRPSWNVEPFVAALEAPPPGPQPVKPPAAPLDLSKPIPTGLKNVRVHLRLTNASLTCQDDLMARKTTVALDAAVDLDGVVKPLTVSLTGLVDSNGRSGKIAIDATANLFDSQGRIDLFDDAPPRLQVKSGDMVTSLPLQALIDHLTEPPPAAPGAPERIFTAADLPLQPNLLGRRLDYPVTVVDASQTDRTGAPLSHTVDVNLAHLGDLGVTWSQFTVSRFKPLALQIAGAVDVSDIGGHRDWSVASGGLPAGGGAGGSNGTEVPGGVSGPHVPG
ncbi:MAG: FHA domain-containing protein, partial [Planctomycetota bacterium]